MIPLHSYAAPFHQQPLCHGERSLAHAGLALLVQANIAQGEENITVKRLLFQKSTLHFIKQQ
jgi:hypothetical protein